jgi:hypothetical protein
VLTTKVITDVVTPGFYSLLECGKFLPLNPVDIRTTTETRIPGTGTHSSGFNGTCYLDQSIGPSWALTPWTVVVPGDDPTITAQVVNAAIADAKSAVFDALTWAAELKKTAAMFRDRWSKVNGFAIKAAARARRKARSRGLRNPAAILDLFTSYWLEYRYGWRPLMYDVRNAVKALQTSFDEKSICRGSSTTQVDLSDSLTYTGNVGALSYSVTEILTGSRIYRGKAWAEPLGNGAIYGFDPIVTAWELVPYSFVVDWFIGVGTWLEAVSPFSGAKLLGSMVSIKDDYELTQYTTLSWASSTESGGDTGRETRLKVKRYTRVPDPGTLPSWNPRLTVARIVDLVALVLQGRSRVYSYLR